MFPDLWGAVSAFVTMPGVQAIVLTITAVATAGSVITALVISSRAERRQNSRDYGEARAGLERRAERQAVLIKVSPGGSQAGGGSGQMNYRGQVNNFSMHAIFEVQVALLSREPAGKEVAHWGGGSGYLAGGNSNFFDVFSVAEREAASINIVGARATFLDVYGDRWALDSDGTLALIAARSIQSTAREAIYPMTRGHWSNSV